MKKTIITIIAILAVASAITGGAVISTMSVNSYAVAQNDSSELSELKAGKYVKENGTDDEYIEVFDDGTIQMFGYDYWGELIKLNGKDEIESKTEEDKQELRQFGEYITGRHKYVYNDVLNFIHFKDTPDGDDSYDKSPYGFEHPNESTIIFDKEAGYIYHYIG